MNVAMVYMPFGPTNLPGLGMEVLAQSIRRRGHTCRVKYLNLRFVDFLPGQSFVERCRAVAYLSGRHSFPFNEFLFTRALYSEDVLAPLGASGEAFRARLEALPPYRRNDSFAERFRLSDGDLLRVRDAVPEFLDACLEELDGFDVIGFSSSFHQNIAALALARLLKARRPDVITAFGGANCDGEMGAALHQTYPWVDYVFSGEADMAFPDVLDRLEAAAGVDDIQGLSYRRGGLSRSNAPAAPVQDLEQVATPCYDEFVDQIDRSGFREVQPLILVLESSRGCWWGAKHHCTFCGLNANGMGFRQKSIDRMMGEFEQIAAYDPAMVAMGDNIMPANYFGDFLDRLARLAKPVRLFYETKANLKRSTVARMKRAGIKFLQPGIESFDSGVLQLMKKGVRGIQNVRLVRDAREFGITLTYSILYGFPGEDPNAYRAMLPQLRHLTHLQPPGAVVRVEYHRFSPYHMNPAAAGLSGMRPVDGYRFLYPSDDEALQRLAYFFNADYAYPENPEDYSQPIRDFVAAWQRQFALADCRLVHVDGHRGTEVVDRRSSAAVCYELQGFARTVYTRLREEASLATLCALPEADPDAEGMMWLAQLFGGTASQDVVARQYGAMDRKVYALDRDTFARQGEAILDEWASQGLVYREKDSYLALSVPYHPLLARGVQPARSAA